MRPRFLFQGLLLGGSFIAYAAHLENRVLDNGLSDLNANATNVYLCSTEPTSYTEASSTYKLASASNGAGFTAPLFGAPAAHSPNGRQVTSAAVAAAAVTATGTAAWVAYTTAAALQAVLSMTSQALTSGNTWSQAATTIAIPAQ